MPSLEYLALGYGPAMFVVTVTYTAPLAEVDPWRPAHGDWLNDLISRRLLLAVGRQVPLVGGVYLAAKMPVEDLDRILATDPYVLNGVASHSVVEFEPLLVASGLEDLKREG
ncbi:YciI family protein [Streptomyces sp. NRRL S-337]|uniref:YciI family protein n=1 Tax=Streptomyces sp. NRRL S-337 TaxID=1463900 RepID=UPI00068E3FAC|nr:YciI family protein [Streptomyces sp. NRRL S-337]